MAVKTEAGEQEAVQRRTMKTTLKSLREENKKTLTKVASVLGVTIQAAYRYEQGKRRICLEHVLILSTLYDCSAEEVIKAQLNSCLNVQ